jgi:PAS domain S-box-containing protein
VHTIGLLITNPIDRDLLKDHLQEADHAVLLPTPASDFLQQLERASAVITDEQGARAAGSRLLELRWRAGNAFLPLLILLRQNADGSAWLRAGFDDVLRLPITKAELFARLSVFLRLRDQSVEQYRGVFENALIGIYRTTLQGRILMANPAVVQMLGYDSVEELARVNLQEIKTAPAAARADLKARLEREGQVIGAESCWTRRDGSRLHVRETARAIRDDAGRTLYYDGTVEDISELKRVEQAREALLAREQAARLEAEAISRTKDEFLATLSHELRTPMNAIMGWLQILRRGQVDGEAFSRAFEAIDRNTRAQANLIEDLLEVSRIITGKLRLEIQAVDLPPVIQAAADAIQHEAEAKNINLQIVIADDVGTVEGDPSRLQQIVWNLLANAIKFTPPGGQVRLCLAAAADGHVEINVSDTGQGISADFLPHVFERFRQADGSLRRKHGGLGLGLAIVRHLTELHGGSVAAHSDGDGKGASFKIRLPLLVASDSDGGESSNGNRADARRNAASRPLINLRGLRLLVVEDDADSREMITTMLECCGAMVKTVPGTAEALELLKHWHPDVLVSDIEMPDEDGYSLIQKVRALPIDHVSHIPSIALTAHAGSEDRLRSLRAGFNAHVAKPLQLPELAAVIVSLAGAPQQNAH